MRVIGHMVVRNEYGRYLTTTLPSLQRMCDVVTVFDDQSEDGTLEFARSVGAVTARRPDSTRSFAENESSFRQAAWREMEDQTSPTEEDWILSLDADELLVVAGPDPLPEMLWREERAVLAMHVDEVFGFDVDGVPLVRRDGFWGQITACRLVRWIPGACFDHRIQGGGSVPTACVRHAELSDSLSILHLGYARPEDRYNKHERYSNKRGHSPTHIASILQRPSLHRWSGEVPLALQGVS